MGRDGLKSLPPSEFFRKDGVTMGAKGDAGEKRWSQKEGNLYDEYKKAVVNITPGMASYNAKQKEEKKTINKLENEMDYEYNEPLERKRHNKEVDRRDAADIQRILRKTGKTPGNFNKTDPDFYPRQAILHDKRDADLLKPGKYKYYKPKH